MLAAQGRQNVRFGVSELPGRQLARSTCKFILALRFHLCCAGNSMALVFKKSERKERNRRIEDSQWDFRGRNGHDQENQ
jgi:hypothetical protein